MSDAPGCVAAGDKAGIDLGSFLRLAAHEMANPLAAISMNAELAKMLIEHQQAAQAAAILQRLLDDCMRFGLLIQGIQKFGSGLDKHPVESVAASTVIADAIDLVSQERLGLSLPTFRVDGDDAMLRVDRTALANAFAALLHNAAEAGSDAVAIHITRDGDWLEIAFSDNGCGIPPEACAKMLDTFYSTRRAEGKSGLGFTLAHEVLNAHGGKLTIGANEPQGMRVRLRLPLASGAARA